MQAAKIAAMSAHPPHPQQALADQLIDNIEAFVGGTPVNAVAPKL